MKKIALLGVENSHAKAFLGLIKNDEKYSDIEVVGIYSEEEEPVKALAEEFGVHIMASPDEAVGKIDGLVITARHGSKHLEFAKPYFESGIPMFIDKPVAYSEDEAIALARELVKNNIKFCGGSSVIHAPALVELREKIKEIPEENLFGGFFRAPISPNSPYGGFSFYAPHLIALVTKIYGNYPDFVSAERVGDKINGIITYGTKKAHFSYTDDSWKYYAYVSHKNGVEGGEILLTDVYKSEFDEFYKILSGGECKTDVRDFISSVFIFSAIERAFTSGATEAVNKIEL